MGDGALSQIQVGAGSDKKLLLTTDRKKSVIAVSKMAPLQKAVPFC